MNATIDDLLNALQNPDKPSKLENTSELDDFLAEWISENPYNNL